MASTAELASYRALLGADSWFGNLPAPMQDLVCDLGQVREFTRGTRLFSRGDATDGVVGLLDGRLEVVGENEHGEQAMLAYLDPVSWIGEIGLFDRQPRMHTVRSQLSSVVLWIDDAKLRDALDAQPSFWYHAALLLTRKLRLTFFLLDGRQVESNEVRVGRILLRAAEMEGYQPGRQGIRVGVPQQFLADALGFSRQTVNTVLQKLKTRNIISMSYGRVEITDLGALKELVHYDNWLPVSPKEPD